MKLLHATAALVFLLACSTCDASAVDDACQSLAAGTHKHAIGYDYCVNFFQNDKGSAAAADHQSLTAIAAKMVAAIAKSAAGRIAHLRGPPRRIRAG